jgi:hypothetical protein
MIPLAFAGSRGPPLDAVRRLQPGKIVRSRLSGDSPIVLGIALVFVGKVITMKGSLKPRIEGVRFISSWPPDGLLFHWVVLTLDLKASTSSEQAVFSPFSPVLGWY